MRHGQWFWDEEGAPATGPMIITVDLDAQVLSVFRDGYEIGTSVILYGADEKPTPLGVFAISQKDADHVSNLYGAPMPYMLRLTNDGVAIHGSDVQPGYMTMAASACPTAFAKRLFGKVKRGDRVIVTNGEVLELGRRDHRRLKPRPA
jgi:lipoprotein-anchoring transpeptidase ErfK/SrfK